MLGLLFTTFLSIFCCSSVVNNSVDHTKELQEDEIILRDSQPKGAVVADGECLVFRSSEFLNYAGTGFFKKYPQAVSTPANFNHYATSYSCYAVIGDYDINLAQPLQSSNIRNCYLTYDYVREYNEGTFNVRVWNMNVSIPTGVLVTVTFYLIWMGGTNFTITYHAPEPSSFFIFFSNLHPSFGTNDSEIFDIMSYTYLKDQIGYDEGYLFGFNSGRQQGYNEGYIDAQAGDPVATSIFNGIVEIGLLPINVFLTIFNFEVFGINISGLVSALLTVSIVMIILRFLFNGKSGDE